MDSKGTSGYRIPLQEEFRSSVAVVEGVGVSEKKLSENTEEAGSWTATEYAFRVDQALRGSTEESIVIRTKNDSGRYPIDIGKPYLLFLGKSESAFTVTPCGNSMQLDQEANLPAFLIPLVRRPQLHNGVSYRIEWPRLQLDSENGERIEEFSFLASCARFVAVTNIPDDWSLEIVSPVSERTTLKASAGHGASYLSKLSAVDGVVHVQVASAECFSLSGSIVLSSPDRDRKIWFGGENFSFTPVS